jgi:predicted outer membrane repeat protein
VKVSQCLFLRNQAET